MVEPAPPTRLAPRHIALIGGGITGLSAALALQDAQRERGLPLRVTLLEANERLGGVMSTRHIGPFLLEEGPESFVSVRPAAVELCERLGVELVTRSPEHARTLIARRGRLHPMPSGFQLLAPSALWPLATTPLLSPLGKVRAALDLILPRGAPNADESVGSFVRRRLGDEVLDRLVEPVIGGIHSGHPDELSLGATLPRFQELEQRHRSLVLGMQAAMRSANGAASAPKMLTPSDGMGHLVSSLESRLDKTTILKNTAVRALVSAGRGYRLRLETGVELLADAVIVALPARAATRLLRTLDKRLSDPLGDIPTTSGTTINLVFERSCITRELNASGYVAAVVDRPVVKACTFTSAKYPGRSDDGHVVLRAFVRDAPEDPERVLAQALPELRQMLGLRGEPKHAVLCRHHRLLPRYALGHIARVETIERRLERHHGLALAGNPYRGVGVSDCIESGRRAADKIATLLATTRDSCAPSHTTLQSTVPNPTKERHARPTSPRP
jgi:protoporphyrinogen/coproporphyrinogen III oxidase